jgi:hypothetical protein
LIFSQRRGLSHNTLDVRCDLGFKVLSLKIAALTSISFGHEGSRCS